METEVKDKQFCLICGAEVLVNLRYPNYVCRSCADKASAADGSKLKFCNESLSGGFLAFYAETNEPYDSHICFIEGIKCRADEARFGGIVVEKI